MNEPLPLGTKVHVRHQCDACNMSHSMNGVVLGVRDSGTGSYIGFYYLVRFTMDPRGHVTWFADSAVTELT